MSNFGQQIPPYRAEFSEETWDKETEGHEGHFQIPERIVVRRGRRNKKY